jgi:hypothetical protein
MEDNIALMQSAKAATGFALLGESYIGVYDTGLNTHLFFNNTEARRSNTAKLRESGLETVGTKCDDWSESIIVLARPQQVLTALGFLS